MDNDKPAAMRELSDEGAREDKQVLQPTDAQLYLQVLRAVGTTIAGLLVSTAVVLIWHWFLTLAVMPLLVPVIIGAFFALPIVAWGAVESVLAAYDLLLLPPSWERRALHVALAVMLIGNTECAVFVTGTAAHLVAYHLSELNVGP